MSKINRITKNTALVFSVMLTVLAACFIFTTGVMAAGDVNEIVSASLNKAETDVAFEIRLTKECVKQNKSRELYLFEFLPYQSTSSLDTMEPIRSFKAKTKISFKLPFVDGNSNRLYSKFAVAEKHDDGSYSLITSAVYINNVEITADNTEPYPEKNSKKGLDFVMFSDAQQLGVSHTVINVAVNEYILGESSERAMSFHYNGQTYYLDKNKIAVLDHKVKTYTEAGMNVYFNIILTAPAADAHPSILNLYCDNISPEATLYALNTKNEGGMNSFRAFMDYICARYTDPSHTYGFVPALIMGFEVNSNTVWNNVGTSPLSNYVYDYCTAFRVAYTAMRSNYSEGRVYVSLGNNFNYVAYPEADFPAKDFLDVFAAAIKNSGDIPWGVSINPHTSTYDLTEYWNDAGAKEDYETPHITMKNIGTFTSYMERDALLYDSEPRSIIIGEWAVSGDPADSKSMDMQAAAYALAYYTVDRNEHIDAFIYKRQIDRPEETAFYGLWSNSGVDPNSGTGRKTIYNVFAEIDTEKSEEATAFVREAVGSGTFSILMGDNVKYKQFIDRNVLEAASADVVESQKWTNSRVLFDLTGGTLCGFYPSDGAEYVELRPVEDGSGTMLYARIMDISTEFKGISNAIASNDAFDGAKYITLRVRITAPAEVNSVKLAMKLANNGGNGKNAVVCDGEVQLVPNEWHIVAFNIKDFCKLTDGDVDVMKLWIASDGSASVGGEYGLWLESVTLQIGKGMPVIVKILLALLVFILLAVAAYGVLFLRAQLIRKKRREAAMRRRREQLQMQTMQHSRIMNVPGELGDRRSDTNFR